MKAREASKSLALLLNPATPMIKKRQVMFCACGDYRAKMKKEEAKNSLEKGNLALFSIRECLTGRFIGFSIENND